MKSMLVREVLEAVKGTFYGETEALDREIRFVTSDSRNGSEGALFVAFKGARADGHDFMQGCLKNGTVCCLSERIPTKEEEPCIVVESTLSAMGSLAEWHRSRFDIPVIGITGSVGKTTTKEMIAAVLNVRFNVHKTEKNFNNELGVPQTLLKLDDSHEVSVVEMGISNFGEMSRLTRMVHPKIAVISVIGDAHLEFLGDHAGVLRAKGEIFESMSEQDLAILNGDDETLHDFYPNTRRMTYGMGEGNDITASQVENLGVEGLKCVIKYKGRSFEVHIPGFGIHMVYAALAGASVGIALGMSDEEIAQGIANYQVVGERARVIHTDEYTIISDCYNANPSSTSAALRSLAMIQGRKVAILGDMLELGENTESLHREIGRKAVDFAIDLTLTAGKLSAYTYEGVIQAGGKGMWFETKEQLMCALSHLLQAGDTILIKASHSCAFEAITKQLTETE